MKTRIFFTKFWKDSYIGSLSVTEKLIFNYLLSNEYIGLSNIYECSERNIMFDLGISKDELDEAKHKFESDWKFLFHKDFIFIINGDKYNQYKGERNEVAKQREMELIGNEVVTVFQDRVSIGYRGIADTPINKKSKIINKKSEIRNKENWNLEKLRNGEITQELIKTFPKSLVEKEIPNMIDWLESKGTTKKNYLAFARIWLRKSEENWKVGNLKTFQATEESKKNERNTKYSVESPDGKVVPLSELLSSFQKK